MLRWGCSCVHALGAPPCSLVASMPRDAERAHQLEEKRRSPREMGARWARDGREVEAVAPPVVCGAEMRWRCPGKDMLGWGHGRENCAAAVKVCVVVGRGETPGIRR